MRTGVGVWLRVMKRENMGLCNGREQEREAEKRLEEREREREWGEKERGPNNGNKTGTHVNSVWI